ncbi:MAG: response regulator transcription factor [Halothiobacillaceae bacterium]|nr:MAG: response regulator transcription factor [Halothiobacillaceae bacterium]
MIRIALADDQNLVRQALRMHLDGQRGIEVVADVASGEDLMALAERDVLHVVLVDIHMPGMGGLEAMRRLRAMERPPRILALSSITTPGFVSDLFRDALIDGYLSKEAAGEDLVRAVLDVAAGRRFICLKLAEAMGDAPEGSAQRFASLTEREREVLMQVFAGHDNKAIAQNLMLSDKTVSQHKQNALRKLGVGGEIEAYRLARLEGWVE